MRVTSNSVSDNYLRHLGRTAEDLSKARQKAATKRKYLSVEEDPGAYVQESRIIRDYSRNEDYTLAASQADALLKNQDKVMQEVIDMSKNLSKHYSIEALNDTNAAQRKIYAAQIESLQEAMVRILNSNESGDFIFAGADGKRPPFELEDGRLYYRGLDVETGRKKDGTLPDAKKGEKTLDMLNDEKLYYDLGYGLDTNPGTAGIPSGNGSGLYGIKDSSAFNVSTSGLKAIGWADKYDNTTLIDSIDSNSYQVPVDKGENLVNLAGKLAKMLREYDRGKSYTEFAKDESGVLLSKQGSSRTPMRDAETKNFIYEKNTAIDKDGFLINKFTGNKVVKKVGPPKEYFKSEDVATNQSDWNKTFSKTLKKFDAAYNRALETETGIGVKMNFVDVTKKRLDLSEDVLNSRFEEIASVPPEKAFTDYSFAQYQYNTALRLGMSIIPKTLAEFMPL